MKQLRLRYSSSGIEKSLERIAYRRQFERFSSELREIKLAVLELEPPAKARVKGASPARRREICAKQAFVCAGSAERTEKIVERCNVETVYRD